AALQRPTGSCAAHSWGGSAGGGTPRSNSGSRTVWQRSTRVRRGRSPCCPQAARCRARRWRPFFREGGIIALQPRPRLLPFEMVGAQDTPDLAASDRHAVLGQLVLQAIQGPMAGGRHLPVGWFGQEAACLGDHPAIDLLVIGAGAS